MNKSCNLTEIFSSKIFFFLLQADRQTDGQTNGRTDGLRNSRSLMVINLRPIAQSEPAATQAKTPT